MELTKKEGEILEFIEKYKCCKSKHIRAFIKMSEILFNKRIERLLWQKKIEFDGEIIKLRNSNNNKNLREQENMLKILDIVSVLKSQDRIKEIEIMDLPFYVMARSAKQDVYLFFSFINENSEMIQLKLIDNENRGNTILVLESEDQKKYLNILATKIKKIIIYEDFIKT